MAQQTSKALNHLVFFRYCFRLYMAVMGNARVMSIAPRDHGWLDANPSVTSEGDVLAVADARATSLGEIYRGAGVFVGFLGVTALVLMIAPSALRMNPGLTMVCGVARVLVIACAPAIAFFIISREWKENWVAARVHAERLRYQPLQQATEELKTAPTMHSQALINDILGLLSGPHGQVAYNRRKHQEYTVILQRTKTATVIAFATSLLGAAAQLVWNEPALLVLTALIPAFVGGLHGVNGFLNISRHAEDNRRLAGELDTIREQVLRMQVKCEYEGLASAAQQAYQLLTVGNSAWMETANKQVVAVF
ncbi:hypothetical protein ACI48D_20070 [Massilia sp. LXY-6]|uniref:hypothetical protein n=1 Tax=Massilia sp. LXY-6 TaxID=3379823 RepID=UPI003EDF878F